MLERGEVASFNELAQQQGVNPSLIGRTLRLATSNHDISHAILVDRDAGGIAER